LKASLSPFNQSNNEPLNLPATMPPFGIVARTAVTNLKQQSEAQQHRLHLQLQTPVPAQGAYASEAKYKVLAELLSRSDPSETSRINNSLL